MQPYQPAKPSDAPYQQFPQPANNPYQAAPQYYEHEGPLDPMIGGPDAQMALNQDSAGFAADINKLHGKQSSCHCQAFIGTLFLIGGIVAGVILYLNGTVSIGVMAGIIGAGYVLYLIISCCCNKLRPYLKNIEHGENFEKYYNWICQGVGLFWFHAECYHYQTRHHTRTVRDGNGNSRTEHYTTTEKVVTHRASENLNPIKTIDQSGQIDQIRAASSVIFVHFLVRHRFSDPQSQNNFNNFFYNFKRRHHYDMHQTFTYGYTLPGLVERKAFFIGELGCNYHMWYYLCGLVGLLWPYSLCVESKINRFDVVSMKVVTV